MTFEKSKHCIDVVEVCAEWDIKWIVLKMSDDVAHALKNGDELAKKEISSRVTWYTNKMDTMFGKWSREATESFVDDSDMTDDYSLIVVLDENTWEVLYSSRASYNLDAIVAELTWTFEDYNSWQQSWEDHKILEKLDPEAKNQFLIDRYSRSIAWSDPRKMIWKQVYDKTKYQYHKDRWYVWIFGIARPDLVPRYKEFWMEFDETESVYYKVWSEDLEHHPLYAPLHIFNRSLKDWSYIINSH